MSDSAPPPNFANFDRVARLYRWAEYLTLGPLLQQTRRYHLEKLQHCRQALLFGDGDGRFLARLLARNPHLQATAIDTSAAMLRLLRDRCQAASRNSGARLATLQASAQTAPLPPGTDLIVTHFFLDCLQQPEVDTLSQRIAAAVRPGALWLISDFAIPALSLLRTPARLYVRALYFAFRLLTGLRVTTLPDTLSSLTAAGFRRIDRHEKLGGLLYSELWVYDPVHPSRHNPSTADLIHSNMASHDTETKQPAPSDFHANPLPDPEPIAPSLDEPDPGVFHHEPGTPQQSA